MDMIAGPSEILVICDGQTDPDWIAMDLFSQAEHDEQAQSILICPDAGFLDKVEESMARLLPEMERKKIIVESLKSRGRLLKPVIWMRRYPSPIGLLQNIWNYPLRMQKVGFPK